MITPRLSLPLIASLLLTSAACGEPDNERRPATPQGPTTISLQNHSFEDADMGDAERLALHNGWDFVRHLGSDLAYVVKILPEHFNSDPAALVDGEEAISLPLKPIDYYMMLSTTETPAVAGEVYELSVTALVRADDIPPTDVGLTFRADATTALVVELVEPPAPGEFERYTLRFTVPESMDGVTLRAGFFAFNGGEEEADILFDNVELKRLSAASAPEGLINPDFEAPSMREGMFMIGAPGWQPQQLHFFGISHHNDTILPGGPLVGDNVLELGVRSDNLREVLTYPFANASAGESYQIDVSLRPRTDVDAPETALALVTLNNERIVEDELADLHLLEDWQAFSICTDIDASGPLRFGFEVFRTADNDVMQRLLLDNLQIVKRDSPCEN